MIREHLDEAGRPCAHHVLGADAAVLALALVGARASTFHHELASKLQRLLFSLDELEELVGGGDGTARALDQARGTLHELRVLLDGNRALTRAPIRRAIGVAELVGAAGLHARVRVTSPLPADPVAIAVPALTHALALLLEAAVAPGEPRAIAIAFARSEERAVLAIPIAEASAPLACSTAVAIAAFAIARDGGELRCGSDGRRFVVHLPLEPAGASST